MFAQGYLCVKMLILSAAKVWSDESRVGMNIYIPGYLARKTNHTAQINRLLQQIIICWKPWEYQKNPG